MDGLPYRRIYTGEEEPRLRVNDSHISLDPRFGGRPEAGAPGIAFIDLDTDIFDIMEAHLRLELWGGHPGTAAKRVTVNGRGCYYLPETGTALGHCTYSDLLVPIATADLIRGRNSFQFGCDRGSSFWGHYIIDNLALELSFKDPPLWVATRISYVLDCAHIGYRSLEGDGGFQFFLTPAGEASLDNEAFMGADIFVAYPGIRLPLDGERKENEGRGYMRGRRWQGHLGRLDSSNRMLNFELSRLPHGTELAEFHAEFSFPGGVFTTLLVGREMLPEKWKGRMLPFFPVEQPVPFWSRAGQPAEARFVLDKIKSRRWKLQVRFWNGGAGNISEPVTLNGQPLNIIGPGAPHDLEAYEISFDSSILREGENRFTLLSDTEHHGIELLYPGPVILGFDKEG